MAARGLEWPSRAISSLRVLAEGREEVVAEQAPVQFLGADLEDAIVDLLLCVLAEWHLGGVRVDLWRMGRASVCAPKACR
jgi:hypothetical protein